MIVEQSIQSIKRDPYEAVIQSLKKKDLVSSFNKYLYAFFKSSPTKNQIEQVGIAIQKRKKQSLHYRDIADLLVVILKLLHNLIKNDRDNIEEKFNEKHRQLSQKLKNEQVLNWIKQLKLQIVYQNQIRFKKGNQDTDKIKNIKDQRDRYLQILKNIGRNFYSQYQIQRKINNKQIENEVLKIKRQNEQISRHLDEISHKQGEMSTLLLHLGKKYELKGNNEFEIIQQMDQNLLSLNVKIDFLKKRISDYEINIKKRQQQIGNLQYKNQKYQNEIKNIKIKMGDFNISADQNIARIFLSQSDIIELKYIQNIIFLRKSIKKLTNIDGLRSKLLYSSAYPHPTQFHKFFRNKRNILLLIKLTNKNIIGGFTHQEIKPQCNNQRGFIFNFTKMETYQRKNRSSITYDDTYLIFGNSEICIKANDMNLFSNFGIQQSYFDHKGRDVSYFLNNDGRRDINMERFQIFQVFTE